MGIDEGGTIQHRRPRPRARGERRPALVVAFPDPAALPLPESNEPIGRLWMHEHGVLDEEVSTRHFALETRGKTLLLQDAGSSNGTWLDGRRLGPGERVELGDGAVIRAGRTILVYRTTLEGSLHPAAPVGGLVGPYGLRGLATTLGSWERHPPANVLIEGETGTGKELAATAVATALGRAKRYVAINVAGVADGVFESQLFGHVAGAFSGAGAASEGLVGAYDGGAVFLDEIGELPLELQPKLLRLLENREVLPVGGHRPRTVDVVIIGATNQDLDQLVAEGRFRQDLLARFAAARLSLPPLRERAEDVWAIAQAVAPKAGLNLTDRAVIEVEAVERLTLEPWPSNIRDLIAALTRAAQLEREGLSLWGVEEVLGPRVSHRSGQLTAESVRAALATCDGNESEAARRLAVSRGRLRRFMDKEMKDR